MENIKPWMILVGIAICCALINCQTEDYTDIETEENSSGEHNVSVTLKFETPCTTPNNEVGYCMDVAKCPAFAKLQITPTHPAYEYFVASNCTPIKATTMKVCCSKKHNFNNYTPKQPGDINFDPDNILPKNCGKQKLMTFSRRILGGVTADLGEFPWMGRLIHRDRRGNLEYGCSAFLIHERFAVTAAHCMNKKLLRIMGPIHQIVLGDHDSSTAVDCTGKTKKKCAPPPQRIAVADPIVYSGYDTETGNHNNDIALVKLKTAAEFTDFVSPICLQETKGTVNLCTVTGWGKTETEEGSDVKKKVDVDRFPLDACIDLYRDKGVMLNKKNQLCAGGQKNKDTCTGDSGGPLMILQDDTWYAEGIVSFGIGCGEEGLPGVYTNLPTYVPWIKNMISKKMTRARSKLLSRNRKT